MLFLVKFFESSGLNVLPVTKQCSMHSGKRTSHSYDVRNTDGVKDQGLNCRAWMLYCQVVEKGKVFLLSCSANAQSKFFVILIMHNCIFRRFTMVSFINSRLQNY